MQPVLALEFVTGIVILTILAAAIVGGWMWAKKKGWI